MSAVEALGKLQQGGVGEVIAIMNENIAQAETEAQLRDELEVRKVEVAAGGHLEIAVQRLRAQCHVLAGREVDGGCYADGEVGAEVVVARCGDFQRNGYGEVGRFEVLGRVAAAELFVEDDVLLPEVNGRLQAQTKVFRQTNLAEHADDEARLVVIDVRVPLFIGSRVYVAIVLQFQVHHIHADEETVVQETVVQIGTVLDAWFLGGDGRGRDNGNDK